MKTLAGGLNGKEFTKTDREWWYMFTYRGEDHGECQSICECCGAGHYGDVDEFNTRSPGIATIVNPKTPLYTDRHSVIEKVQLGDDVLYVKLRMVL